MTHEDHYDRALEALATGEFDRVVAEYNQALELNPTFTEALLGLAQADGQQGKLDETIAAAKRRDSWEPWKFPSFGRACLDRYPALEHFGGGFGGRGRRAYDCPGLLYLGRFDPASGKTREWPSPGGAASRPYGITNVGNVVWYSESGVEPNT